MSNIFADYEKELRTSHLPCSFFSQTAISLVLESPRLFIFSTSKVTPVRLLPVVCSPNPAIDPQIVVQVVCEHFSYEWRTRLSNLDQSSQSWNIKPTNPCGLDPFQLQILVSIEGERRALLDRYANIVCKASEFPKGLAHLLIQERNGKHVTPEVFHKLKKKKSVPGIRLDMPHTWEPIEQWRVIDNIWHTLDPKNADRPLCKPSGPFPILQPSQQFIDSISSNPLSHYRSIWIWVYGVLRFYTSYYNSMKNHIGRIPECIDRRLAEERLYNSSQPSLLIYFGKEGETIVCSTWENGNFEHHQFSWKSKPTAKTIPIAQLPKHLIQLSSQNFQYISPPEYHIRLDEVINLFSICLNQPLQSTQAPDTRVLASHCQLLTQYIHDMRSQGNSAVSLDQLENSLREVIQTNEISCSPTSHPVSPMAMSPIAMSPGSISPQSPIPQPPMYTGGNTSMMQQLQPQSQPQPQHHNQSHMHQQSQMRQQQNQQTRQPQSPMFTQSGQMQFGTQSAMQYHPAPGQMRNSAPTFTNPFSYNQGQQTHGQQTHGQQAHGQQAHGQAHGQFHGNNGNIANQFSPNPFPEFPAGNAHQPTSPGMDDQEITGDYFLELINNSGPDDMLFSSLYPQGSKKRKLNQAFVP